MADPFISSKTPSSMNLCQPKHHLATYAPFILSRLFCFTLITVLIGFFNWVSSVCLSQPFLTVLALHLIMLVATHNHSHTGRCPINLVHSEQTFLHIIWDSIFCFYYKIPFSLKTAKLSTLAPSVRYSGSLLRSPN